MATSYNFYENTKNRLAKLRKRTGAASNTEVIRNAVALLEMASREDEATIIIKSTSGTMEILVT